MRMIDCAAAASIEGGKGNDTLYADEWGSKDTLRFNLGDGQDTIYSYDLIDSGVQDIVQFGKGITQEMVGFARSGDNLVVMVGDSGDQMTFRDFFADTSSQTFTRFEFTDGSAWSNIQETARWKSTDFTPAIRGTDGNDVLRGGGIFEGGKGNDTIFAQELNSKDTLRFNLGDGQDTIYSRDLLYSGVQDTVQFGKGITQEMIDFVRAENGDLLVKVGNQGDQMTFRNFFADKNSQTFTALNLPTAPPGAISARPRNGTSAGPMAMTTCLLPAALLRVERVTTPSMSRGRAKKTLCALTSATARTPSSVMTHGGCRTACSLARGSPTT
ncbi:Haemolysin-type calcium binding protein related domain [Serratia fonticola]|uniref:Haemolysin-type calcium binding protein related domain n=1 Tax=Serratia fonticola TaxID=47917 RepID=A0A4U9VW13_SERFO|nr:Haemolysin-type calcium binding protein related domain [Serratia fonticola]